MAYDMIVCIHTRRLCCGVVMVAILHPNRFTTRPRARSRRRGGTTGEARHDGQRRTCGHMQWQFRAARLRAEGGPFFEWIPFGWPCSQPRSCSHHDGIDGAMPFIVDEASSRPLLGDVDQAPYPHNVHYQSRETVHFLGILLPALPG